MAHKKSRFRKLAFGNRERDRKRQWARDNRPSWAGWYNTAKWKKLRAHILAVQPTCLGCQKPAKVIDHIEPHHGDPEKFWDPYNLQPLCKACHDSKTARFDSRFARRGGPTEKDRVDETGTPVDPKHPWHRR